MITTEIIAPSAKLKIKFSTKMMEVDSVAKREFGREVSHTDERRRFNSNGKSSGLNSNKRGQPDSNEGQKVKRQRVDRKWSVQCATILKSLMAHPYGWVFNNPVDPVALNIPDYFNIIKSPMDFGTIKAKLEKNDYSGTEDFADDVRLTFSNATTYNPPGNDVHMMAQALRKIFDRKWKDLVRKLKCEDERSRSESGTIKEASGRSLDTMHSRHKDSWPKNTHVSEKKGIPKSISSACKDASVEAPKLSHIPLKFMEKDLHKGSKGNRDREQSAGSLKACSTACPVTCKCSICGDTNCHCLIRSNSTQVSSDISFEGSEGRDLTVSGADTLRQDCLTKGSSPMEKKSDSDGTVSSLDSEHICASSKHVTFTTDASSGEVWSTAILPVQLSPKKALRAAMLKSRFADTILKAQQKTLLEHGDKRNPKKMQLEKERLERIQREERARIEAQIKTAEAAARTRAEEESRQRREKEREAARVAIEKMKRTVDIEHNMEIIRELESLSGCTLSYKAVGGRNGYKVALDTWDKPQFENPLERLGLFMKEEYIVEDEEFLNGVREEGEIFN
ncbi:transcription factor GTE9-like isoform X1 [Vigna unguiculata]|uniref:transcription factor GTE9-like isoform X1 n=1 Tax=Vigna unguiculata TaxID=3917 RepID=UPI0010165865|nr:transcription factor GTE9-like isoform X1 [Vigna unguiculata]